MIKWRSLDGHKSTHVSHHAVLYLLLLQEASQHFNISGKWLMVLFMYSVLCSTPATCLRSCRGTVCCVVHWQPVTGLVGV